MSGHKRATITITRDEYDRLREAREGFRVVPEVPLPVRGELIQQRNAALENSLLELSERHDQFEELIKGLNANVRQIEKANADSLLRMQTRTYRQVQRHSEVLWNRIEDLIEEQTRQFNATIAANQNQNQEALHQLSMEIDRVLRSEESKQAAAHEWLTNNVRLYNFINQNYACEFFLPGQMEKIAWQIEIASQNMQSGAFEAALSSAQQIHFRLSDMRLQLEKLQSAWQMLYIDTWETTLNILSQVTESADVPAIDLHGEFLPYPIHVDTWVEDRAMSKLIQDVAAFRDHLDHQGASLSIETLREYREQILPGFLQDLEDLVTRARINAINAQLRINIADFVIQALQEQGFAPSDAGYENQDAQSPFQVCFSNLEGCEVVVQVKPAGAKIGQNELHLESHDAQIRSEDELENRWSAISQSLVSFGLDVGQVVREDRPQYQIPNRRPNNPSRANQSRRNTRGGRTVTTHDS